MPRINANTKNYTIVKWMDSGQLPTDCGAILIEAADLARGNWNWSKPADCVNPELGKGGLLDKAYAAKMPALLRFTVQVDWMHFKPDEINPANDKQLNVFKKALEGKLPGKSYVGIVVGWMGNDSESNTAQTVRFYADQLEKITLSLGKKVPVFIECTKQQWESMPHLQTTIGLETSHWPLLVRGNRLSVEIDPSLSKQLPIYTPGLWKLTNGLLWEEKAWTLRFWEEATTFKAFFGMSPYNSDSGNNDGNDDIPGDTTPGDGNGDDTGSGDVATGEVWLRMAVATERQADATERIAVAIEWLVNKIKAMFNNGL